MRFKYTILYVSDVVQTVEFYKKAFGLTEKFIAPNNDYAEMLSGDVTLSFAAHALIQPQLNEGYVTSSIETKPFGIEIGFVTENVHLAVDHAVAKGAHLVNPPTVKPWGQTVAYVRDCNGFLVELCTSMGS